MTTVTDEDTIGTMSYHTVAFLDILGQGNILRAMNRLPTSDDDWQKVRETWGVVRQFRQSFDSLITMLRARKPKPRMFADPRAQAFYESLSAVKIEKNSFSDFVTLQCSTHDQNGTSLPVIDIWQMLLCCSGIFIMMLRIGKPIRGGISFGPAFDGEAYGNPYCVAYDLESKCAKWPRIVIDRKVPEYIASLDALAETDYRKPIAKHFGELCFKLIAIDLDGNWVLDYLGEGHANNLASDADVKKKMNSNVTTAYTWAKQQYEIFRNTGNPELALRYAQLLNYMEQQMKNWR